MDDLISRQAAIDALDEYIEEYSYDLDENGYHNPKWCAMQEAKMTIQRLPSAERRGRWEHYEHREPQYDIEGYKTWAEAYKCSNCGFIHTVIEDFGHYAFCPRCGVKMEV